MIVVDSSVWIDYFNGVETRETVLLDGVLGRGPIVVGDLILVEVLQGFRAEQDVRRARAALDTLIFESMVGSGHRFEEREQLPDAPRQGRHRAQDHRHADRHVLHGEGA